MNKCQNLIIGCILASLIINASIVHSLINDVEKLKEQVKTLIEIEQARGGKK